MVLSPFCDLTGQEFGEHLFELFEQDFEHALEPKRVEIMVLQPAKVKMKPKLWSRSKQVQHSCVFSLQEDCFNLCSHVSDMNLKTPFFCLLPSVSLPFYLAGALCICLVCLVNSTAWAIREFRTLFLCISHKLAWWKICKFSNSKGNDWKIIIPRRNCAWPVG